MQLMASEEQKDKILRLAKNLRTKKTRGWTKYFIDIHQNLTPNQRTARQKSVQEMKKRKSKMGNITS